MIDPLGRSRPSRPRTRSRPSRSAAGLLESSSATEVEELDIVGEGLGDEMPGAFLTRWAAGMAQTVRLVRARDRPAGDARTTSSR